MATGRTERIFFYTLTRTLVFTLGFLCVYFYHRIGNEDSSILTGVMLGGGIWGQKSLFLTESLSWSRSGESFFIPGWFGELIYYFSSAAGQWLGWNRFGGVRLMHALLLAVGAIGVLVLAELLADKGLIGLKNRRRECAIIAGLFYILVFSFASRTSMSLSDEMWIAAFAPWLICLYYSDRESYSRFFLFAVVLILSLLSNSLMGVVILGGALLFGAYMDIEKSLHRKGLVIFGAALLLECLLRFPFLVYLPEGFSIREVVGLIGLRTPDFHQEKLLAALIASQLVIGWFSKTRFSWTILFLLLSGSLLACFTASGVGIFTLTYSLLVGSVLSEHIDERITARQVSLSCLVFLMAIVTLGTPLAEQQPLIDSEEARLFDERHVQRLFNDIQLGGELSAAGIPIFIDGRPAALFVKSRPESLTGSVMSDYRELIELRARWKEVLSRWSFDSVLIKEGSALAGVLEHVEGWKRAYVLNAGITTRLGRSEPLNYLLLVKEVAS